MRIRQTIAIVLGAAVVIAIPATVSAQTPGPYSWSGWYIGASAGYGWRSINDYPPTSYYNGLGVTFGSGIYSTDTGTSTIGTGRNTGFVGSATFGYNYQINGIVLSGEYDFIYAAIAKDPQFASATFTAGGGPFGTTYTAGNYDPTDGDSNRWYGVARARAGLAMGRWLPFVTGGVAYRLSYASYDPYVASGTTVVTYSGINKSNAWGWVAGAGIEYAWTDDCIIKLEYLHMDFGTASYVDPIASTAVGSPVIFSYKRNVDLVRVGLNFRFSWGGKAY